MKDRDIMENSSISIRELMKMTLKSIMVVDGKVVVRDGNVVLDEDKYQRLLAQHGGCNGNTEKR